MISCLSIGTNASFILLLLLHFLDACTPLFFGHTFAAYHLSLALPHARIDIDVLGSNPQWAMRRILEPAIYLPHEVQDNKERCSHVAFEKVLRTEIWSTNGVKSYIK